MVREIPELMVSKEILWEYISVTRREKTKRFTEYLKLGEREKEVLATV